MGFEKKDFSKGGSKPGVQAAPKAPQKVVQQKPVEPTPKKVVAGNKK
ncbi:hypothetical protein JN09_000370 [Acholeplasma morum]|nr:hypothetical protein [Paracholeplasma morum]MBM7453051.1 hypothetical protein [Paracholeplasma morum]